MKKRLVALGLLLVFVFAACGKQAGADRRTEPLSVPQTDSGPENVSEEEIPVPSDEYDGTGYLNADASDPTAFAFLLWNNGQTDCAIVTVDGDVDVSIGWSWGESMGAENMELEAFLTSPKKINTPSLRLSCFLDTLEESHLDRAIAQEGHWYLMHTSNRTEGNYDLYYTYAQNGDTFSAVVIALRGLAGEGEAVAQMQQYAGLVHAYVPSGVYTSGTALDGTADLSAYHYVEDMIAALLEEYGVFVATPLSIESVKETRVSLANSELEEHYFVNYNVEMPDGEPDFTFTHNGVEYSAFQLTNDANDYYEYYYTAGGVGMSLNTYLPGKDYTDEQRQERLIATLLAQ